MKSWNLNFLEPSGPLQASNGNALPLYAVVERLVVFVHVTETWVNGQLHAPAALHLEIDPLLPSE